MKDKPREMFESATNTVITKGVEPVRWLIIAGIAYTLATTIWTFFDTPVPQPITDPGPASSTKANTPGNVNWILGKHLFGEAGSAPEVTISDEPARETRLPLELQGVTVADVAEESMAIIAQRGKAGLRYRIGSDVPGNAKLVEVLADRVILRRAGARETLMFPKTQFAAVVEDEAPEPASAQPDTRNPAPDTPDILGDYRERLAEDAQGTLAELGIESAETGGYRLGSNAQSAYLQQSGLQPGDVIMSVNGRPVGNIEEDQLELDNVIAQGSARIEVQRGGRRFFITVSLK